MKPLSAKVSKFSASEFRQLLGKHRRGFIAFDNNSQKYVTSHNELFDILDCFNTNDGNPLNRDFQNHEGLYFEVGKESNTIFGAFLHSTRRGAGAGGVRYWTYDNLTDYVCEGLRLSRSMGLKSALAGLWWGGGKGVIWRDNDNPFESQASNDPNLRKLMFEEYGRFVTSLNGCYVAAEDLGVRPTDMDCIFHTSRFVTCISPEFGGSGNPSLKTGIGIVSSMEGALEYDNIQSKFDGLRINVQGFGNVSYAMIENMFERGLKIKEINVFDIYDQSIINQKIDALLHKYPNISTKLNGYQLPNADDNSVLFDENVDIISPCARGGTLNSETIPKIKARYIVGAANNQLLDEDKDDKLLYDQNILYVPDFVANRMGIVNCANEQYGCIANDPSIERHFSHDWDNSLINITKLVLNKSKNENIPSTKAAKLIANELIKEEHPIWPHRSKFIQQSLIEQNWYQNAN